MEIYKPLLFNYLSTSMLMLSWFKLVALYNVLVSRKQAPFTLTIFFSKTFLCILRHLLFYIKFKMIVSK